MARIVAKDVSRGMVIFNRHTKETGTVLSVSADERVRVRLASGKRCDIIPDNSGEIRWSLRRRSS